MTTELWLLLLSLPLYGLYLGAQSTIFRQQHGVEYAATARDDQKADGPLLGRAERALRNFQETWLVFVILALIGHLAVPGDPVIFWGAVVYLVARVAYLPLYLVGIYGVRSLAWMIATLGLLAMTVGVLF